MGALKEVTLSERLQALADMVTRGNRAVDVGCDHGFLSVYLIQRGISPRVLAMDVRRGPLSRAQEHVAAYGLGDYIETRLSDGLEAYCAGEADSLVCAGMGGRLMQKILSDHEDKSRSFKELILQPQSELYEFRKFLRESGYEILGENILFEAGKYYFLMKASWGGCEGEEPQGAVGNLSREPVSKQLQSLYDRYGKLLLTKRHPVLRAYLLDRQRAVRGIEEGLLCQDTKRASKRLIQVREELLEISQALELLGGI